MKKRTKVSLPVSATPGKVRSRGLLLREMQGLVSPVPQKSTTVTLRLSGHWHVLWEQLRAAMPDLSDAEILRQAVAMRLATLAVDAQGEKPKATISFHDETGTMVRCDLEEYVGISEDGENIDKLDKPD